MVFEWLFGEKKKQEESVADVASLLAQAEQATAVRDTVRGEELSRELIKTAPESADAWNLLGVNLIRRGLKDPEVRTEAVIAWMRALALRPGDTRAADHLRVEIQFPEELMGRLVNRLADTTQTGDDAAAVIAQIGPAARVSLQAVVNNAGLQGERARALLAGFREGE